MRSRWAVNSYGLPATGIDSSAMLLGGTESPDVASVIKYHMFNLPLKI